MRWLGCIVPVILLVSAACDNKQDGAGTGSASTASAVTAATTAASQATDAGAATDEGGSKPPVIAMPERPVPRPQTMVGSGMSIEVQQKAIAYMVAMRAPHLDDVPADPTYAGDLVTKLKPIVLSMDNGADKARMDRVEMVANGRQIDLLMAGGCDEKTPMRAVVSRAGVPFATLVSHGVLVIRCNDVKVQCLQSTRDSDDVLCTTAPRHK
ncbi:MAG: hypothetical protein JWO86_2922 [Myxococcaceae bacterium]|jgi:hypothetical protein|nr:hypothetical protein [Myxococcaceae bacterium]